jgi:hypothetical protein
MVCGEKAGKHSYYGGQVQYIADLLWIRIRIGNPDPGARKLRNFSGKMHFLPLKRYKIALTTI